MMTVILVGILGAFISAITGSLWYSNKTPMGRWHMTYLGFYTLSAEEKEQGITEAKPKMIRMYAGQLFLSLLTSLFIAFVTYYTVQNGGQAGAVYSYVFMIWIAFTVPMIGQNMLWGTAKGTLAWKRFFSDSFYNLITFLIIAFAATLILA